MRTTILILILAPLTGCAENDYQIYKRESKRQEAQEAAEMLSWFNSGIAAITSPEEKKAILAGQLWVGMGLVKSQLSCHAVGLEYWRTQYTHKSAYGETIRANAFDGKYRGNGIYLTFHDGALESWTTYTER